MVAGPSGAGKSSLINSLRLGRHRPDLQGKSADPRVAAAAAPPAAAQQSPPLQQPLSPGDLADLPIGFALPLSVVQAYGSGTASAAGGPGGGGGADAVLSAPGPCGTAGGESASGNDAGLEMVGPGGGHISLSDSGTDLDLDSVSAADGSAQADAPEFLAVGQLSKIGRGKHTTTSVTLLRLLGGGWLADTPGFGQPALDE